MTWTTLRAPVSAVRGRFSGNRGWRETDQGQTLVETALVLPILLILLFALVDFGRGFYTWLLVTNAAREGARVAAVQSPQSAVENRIYEALGALDPAGLSISLTNIQGSRGQPVEVDLAYDFEFVTPMGPLLALIGGSDDPAPDITAHSSMRLE